ncbi:MAG TPA: MBL fold metallo-hydrolase, partial [Bacteroidetes bacterium]|nr:MBL fold metallo-hydrolase [Bacteroidota bacterium]
MVHVQTFTFFPEAFAENTYVVWDDTLSCVVIDPGCYSAAEKKQLIQFIEDKGLKLEKVLNTHCHIDHIMGNQALTAHFKVPLLACEKDVYNIELAASAAKMWNMNIDPSPEPDAFLDGGDTLTFGETTFEVLFTPGHSAGHISFYNPAESHIFSGDVIFQQSYGRVDLPGGSIKMLVDTIINKIFTLPEETLIYAGHMGTTTVGAEKLTNP